MSLDKEIRQELEEKIAAKLMAHFIVSMMRVHLSGNPADGEKDRILKEIESKAKEDASDILDLFEATQKVLVK